MLPINKCFETVIWFLPDLVSPSGNLTEQTIQPLNRDPRVGSEGVEHVSDVLPRLVGDTSVVARGEESSSILRTIMVSVVIMI